MSSMGQVYGWNQGLTSSVIPWPRPSNLFVPVSPIMDDFKSPIIGELMTETVESSKGIIPCQRVAPLPKKPRAETIP